MAPKKKTGGGGIDRADQVLQGVVVAEGWEPTFKPLGAPRCLVELCGRPVLEYSLRFLARSGCEEIYVLATAKHAPAIAAYVEARASAGDFVTTRAGAPVAVVLAGAGAVAVALLVLGVSAGVPRVIVGVIKIISNMD